MDNSKRLKQIDNSQRLKTQRFKLKTYIDSNKKTQIKTQIENSND